MACGLTAGRRGAQKNRGYQNILSCGDCDRMVGSSEQSFDNHAGYVFVVVPRLLPDFSRRRRKVVTPTRYRSGPIAGKLKRPLRSVRTALPAGLPVPAFSKKTLMPGKYTSCLLPLPTTASVL